MNAHSLANVQLRKRNAEAWLSEWEALLKKSKKSEVSAEELCGHLHWGLNQDITSTSDTARKRLTVYLSMACLRERPESSSDQGLKEIGHKAWHILCRKFFSIGHAIEGDGFAHNPTWIPFLRDKEVLTLVFDLFKREVNKYWWLAKAKEDWDMWAAGEFFRELLFLIWRSEYLNADLPTGVPAAKLSELRKLGKWARQETLPMIVESGELGVMLPFGIGSARIMDHGHRRMLQHGKGITYPIIEPETLAYLETQAFKEGEWIDHKDNWKKHPPLSVEEAYCNGSSAAEALILLRVWQQHRRSPRTKQAPKTA